MKELRLVLCDIDSTLINDQRELMPLTKEVFDTLHKNGVYLGIASGRPLDELKLYAKNWKLTYDFDVVIGMNGSSLYDGITDHEYSYFKMKREWLKETLALMKNYEANAFIYRDGKILAQRKDAMMLKSAQSSNKEIIVVKSDEEFYEQENEKIMFRVTLEDMPKIEAFIKAHPSPNYNGFKTQATLLEFADRRINKSYALKKLCLMHDFTLDNVLSFGDTSNDNEMLAVSGLGVCMCNGSADTKQCAKDITKFSNNEEGVAQYILDHFGEYLK